MVCDVLENFLQRWHGFPRIERGDFISGSLFLKRVKYSYPGLRVPRVFGKSPIFSRVSRTPQSHSNRPLTPLSKARFLTRRHPPPWRLQNGESASKSGACTQEGAFSSAGKGANNLRARSSSCEALRRLRPSRELRRNGSDSTRLFLLPRKGVSKVGRRDPFSGKAALSGSGPKDSKRPGERRGPPENSARFCFSPARSLPRIPMSFWGSLWGGPGGRASERLACREWPLLRPRRSPAPRQPPPLPSPPPAIRIPAERGGLLLRKAENEILPQPPPTSLRS